MDERKRFMIVGEPTKIRQYYIPAKKYHIVNGEHSLMLVYFKTLYGIEIYAVRSLLDNQDEYLINGNISFKLHGHFYTEKLKGKLGISHRIEVGIIHKFNRYDDLLSGCGLGDVVLQVYFNEIAKSYHRIEINAYANTMFITQKNLEEYYKRQLQKHHFCLTEQHGQKMIFNNQYLRKS